MIGLVALVLCADGPSAVMLGADAFGEFFPVSSVEVPTHMGTKQQSVLTGVRLSVGYQHGDWFRGYFVVEGGYAAAGLRAGNGQDGFMAGVGGEGQYVLHRFVQVLVRVTGDFKVQQRGNLPTGTLADRAIVFSVGARVLRFLDLHVCVGSDFAGGTSVGFGAGLGWQWEIPLPTSG